MTVIVLLYCFTWIFLPSTCNLMLNLPSFCLQYECLVEGCGLKFKNYKARHRHLVDKHKFPTTFEFFKKTQLSKKRREKLQRQRVSKLEHEEDKKDSSDAMEVEDKSSVDGLVSALSTLTTSDSTPSNVSFGRRHGRGLTFVPRSVHSEKRTESSSAPGPKTQS